MIYCEHPDCRSARAAHLTALSDLTGDTSFLAMAAAAHTNKVPCLHDPETEREMAEQTARELRALR